MVAASLPETTATSDRDLNTAIAASTNES